MMKKKLVLLITGAVLMMFLAIGCSVFGLSTVFLGVIARGFERVEAAIKANADDL